MSTRPLTTTSYAILGVLAMRPWSAYDLTGYMRTSAVRHLWPRTESRLYQEPKNLVAHGLAEAKKEYTGRRGRTVYSITDSGRDALAEWLAEPSSAPQTEDEAVLKIFLADFGSVAALRTTILGAVEEMRRRVAVIRDIAVRVEEGEPLFPERIHLSALSASHGVGAMRQRFEYLRWAEEHTRDWDDTSFDEEKMSVTLPLLKARRHELEKLDREMGAFLESAPATSEV